MLDNCPNCGAPGVGTVCEYCGTVLASPEELIRETTGKDVYMCYSLDDEHLHAMKLKVSEVSRDDDDYVFYADDSRYRSFRSSSYVIKADIMPFDENLREVAYAIQKVRKVS